MEKLQVREPLAQSAQSVLPVQHQSQVFESQSQSQLQSQPINPLQSPYPYFGGKATIATIVWQRFGNTPNYVEPFFGSGAVLLARPHQGRYETVNDIDAYIANFWPAIQSAPQDVAHYADNPVNEVDLTARHLWLVTEGMRHKHIELITDILIIMTLKLRGGGLGAYPAGLAADG
jgi:hypothetical protein